MSTLTAKTFQSGNSTALRLPSQLRVKRGKTYQVIPLGDGFRLIDPKELARRRRAARQLWGSAPDFPDPRA